MFVVLCCEIGKTLRINENEIHKIKIFPFVENDLQLLLLSCYLKDPQGVKVDITEEKDYTGIVSFPDFKIPPNPK